MTTIDPEDYPTVTLRSDESPHNTMRGRLDAVLDLFLKPGWRLESVEAARTTTANTIPGDLTRIAKVIAEALEDFKLYRTGTAGTAAIRLTRQDAKRIALRLVNRIDVEAARPDDSESVAAPEVPDAYVGPALLYVSADEEVGPAGGEITVVKAPLPRPLSAPLPAPLPESDPLDEDDHRDRMVFGNTRLVRVHPRHWHSEDHKCDLYAEQYETYSLESWYQFTTVTFAPEQGEGGDQS